MEINKPNKLSRLLEKFKSGTGLAYLNTTMDCTMEGRKHRLYEITYGADNYRLYGIGMPLNATSNINNQLIVFVLLARPLHIADGYKRLDQIKELVKSVLNGAAKIKSSAIEETWN